MKKRVLWYFLILLAMPLALAEINIQSLDQSEYNLGDEVQVSGYLLRDNAFKGFLDVSLECDNQTFNLPSIQVTLKALEKKFFPEDFFLPKIMLPASMYGSCFIRLELKSYDSVLDSATSDLFYITKSLKGDFRIDKSFLQIGDSFSLTGDISHLDDQPVSGSAEIYFSSNNTSYLIDVIKITDGKLNYKYTATPTLTGQYDINLLVYDSYGNSQLFSMVSSFILASDINLFARADKSNLLPGEKLKISGEARTLTQGNINSGNLKLFLDIDTYNTEIKNSDFSYTIILAKNIRSGKHEIGLLAEDLLGNEGRATVTIYITPIATKLENKLNQETFKPGELLQVTPLLYDQANDFIPETLKIEIFDPEDRLIFTTAAKTNSAADYTFESFAEPGVYTIKTSHEKLVASNIINLEPITQADVELIGQKIYITNTGNTKYKAPVKLNFNNGEHTIVEKTSIQPNQTSVIDLTNTMPTGTYGLVVAYGSAEKAFDNLNIIGKSKKGFNMVYLSLAIILALILVYLTLIKRNQMRRVKLSARKEMKKVKAEIKKVKEEKEKKSGLRKKYNFGVSNEHDLKDFKKRVVKEIKATTDKQRPFDLRPSFGQNPTIREEQPKKDMFNMFN